MKSKAPPKPAVALTEEEKLRDARILEHFEKTVGGLHYMTVANLANCSPVQARASLARLCAENPPKIEQYESFGNTTLYRLKREKTSSSWGLRAGS